jgi:V/A-type H+-transporting ATPase subunit K
MEVGLLGELGITLSFGISATGASIGMFANGPAVIGAWKKCYIKNRPAPFIMVVFAATCLSNIIYGFILMNVLSVTTKLTDGWLFGLGVGSGCCVAAVAVTQAMCSAAAADAYAETGQGFGNYLMVVGIAESISLFGVVFTIMFT